MTPPLRYVTAEAFEKAAGIYIFTKNFRKAEPLMDKITTPKLHSQVPVARVMLSLCGLNVSDQCNTIVTPL
jgi:hypothetical protein